MLRAVADRLRAGVDLDAPLLDAGLDSLQTVVLVASLSELFATRLPPTLAFDHPSARLLATAISSRLSR